jgi:hypothetical protein
MRNWKAPLASTKGSRSEPWSNNKDSGIFCWVTGYLRSPLSSTNMWKSGFHTKFKHIWDSREWMIKRDMEIGVIQGRESSSLNSLLYTNPFPTRKWEIKSIMNLLISDCHPSHMSFDLFLSPSFNLSFTFCGFSHPTESSEGSVIPQRLITSPELPLKCQ